jgi:hypothetical protein
MRTDTSRGTFEDVIRSSKPQIAAIAHKPRDLITEVTTWYPFKSPGACTHVLNAVAGLHYEKVN